MSTAPRPTESDDVQIDVENPETLDAIFCIERYFAELDGRFDGGFEPGRSIPADADELVEPHGLLLVARRAGGPIGCAAIKFHGADPAEVKRMWVAATARGLGLGRRLLVAVERRAAARGVTALRLETNRSLTEAIALYRSAGYTEVEAFNDEPFAHHWFEKHLGT
ncbi:MAG: GNAT family N-acetyltransferase [Ilumatobacteraceae bacterium]